MLSATGIFFYAYNILEININNYCLLCMALVPNHIHLNPFGSDLSSEYGNLISYTYE